MQTYLRILSFAKPIGNLASRYFILSILYSIFSAARIGLLIPILDLMFKTTTVDREIKPIPEFDILHLKVYLEGLFNFYINTSILEHGPFQALKFVCVVILISAVLSSIFRYLSDIILEVVNNNLYYNMQTKLFDKINSLPLGYFTNEKKGDLMSRMTNDLGMVQRTVMSSMTVVFREPLMIIIYFIILMNISVKLTMMALLILPISGVIIASLAKRLKRRAKLSQESAGRLTVLLEESLSGMRIIKAFTATKYIIRKFSEEVGLYRKINISIAKRKELASPLSEFLGIIVVLGIVLYGGEMILTQNSSGMSGSTFITFIAIFSQILTPAKNISKSLSEIQKGIASADRIFEIIDTESTIKEKENALELKSFNDAISFRNISFSYKDELVLKDINFEVKKGHTVALVGPSGGGKSTLADLVPRFYDALEGELAIDNIPIKDYKIESLRRKMGIVTQESILFNDTIFNNIAFGVPEANINDVIEAAKIANAHDFIMQSESGYETMIGERGSKLSGGQKQRLSIARAILRNPDILILDEATSALDSTSERLVQEALTKLMAGRTSIVIAHRLSTIQHADEIIVLKKGQIAERGTHEDLVEKKGLYNTLIEMQTLA